MLKLALLIAAIATGGLFGLGKIERQLVYPFDDRRVAPGKAGLRGVREQEVEAGGETLIVWTRKARRGKPTILYFHGNAGNLANRAARFDLMLARGYGLIAPAYRGSSGSTGSPSEAALSDDARRIYARMGALLPGVTPGEVVIYGESLGTGVALKLMAADGIAQPAAVILEAPYTSLPDVALHTNPKLAPLIERMTNIWLSKAHARSLRAPLLVIHGSDDPLIPIAQGREVFNAAGSADKQFLAVEGGGHVDLWRAEVVAQLWRFIEAR